MPFICGIALKPAKRAEMQLVQYATITVDGGMEGNWTEGHDQLRKQQVTVLSGNQWNDARSDMGALGNRALLPWQMRRAQLCVMSIWFSPEHLGKRLSLGKKVILEITEELTLCKLMEHSTPGLEGVLSTVPFGAGVACKVIRGGTISLHDKVLVI